MKHIKLLALVSVIFGLQGCAAVIALQKHIPSFWDDNQSARIVDVRQQIQRINCGEPQWAQAQSIELNLQWFQLYSESKGQRQTDVLKLIKPMQDTVTEWRVRAERSEPSKIYCETKRSVLTTQSELAARAILGRF